MEGHPSEDTHIIKYHFDRSLSAKILGGVLYHMYKELEQYLKDQGHWIDGMWFGSTGTPRMVFLKYPNKDIRVIMNAVVKDDKNVQLIPDEDELKAIHLTRSILDETFKKATSAVAQEKGLR